MRWTHLPTNRGGANTKQFKQMIGNAISVRMVLRILRMVHIAAGLIDSATVLDPVHH